jgi:hypothetical protein
MDTKQVKKIAGKEVKSHEKRMHKMAKGGVTTESMEKYGRNMARAMNQKSNGRGRLWLSSRRRLWVRK